jgi:hypothetical protein
LFLVAATERDKYADREGWLRWDEVSQTLT